MKNRIKNSIFIMKKVNYCQLKEEEIYVKCQGQ